MTWDAEAALLLQHETELLFEGPAVECPVCAGSLDQMAVVLDLEGLEPLNCSGCGAVLAA